MQEKVKSLFICMGAFKIEIETKVLESMISYRQINNDDTEAGGVLIGRVNKGTGNIIIEYLTSPFTEDKRTRYSYHRTDKRHIESFNRIFSESNGIYAYLGEWHTHPEDYPNYSCIDLRNWKSIAKKLGIKDKKYIHIIIGRKSIGVWSYSDLSKKVQRLC